MNEIITLKIWVFSGCGNNSNEIFEKIADSNCIYDHEKMKEFRSISNEKRD